MIERLTSGPTVTFLGGPHQTLELVLGLIVFLAAILWGDRLPLRRLRAFDRRFHRFAANRMRAVVLVFALSIVGRLAILPIVPVPEPQIHDEYSYMLAAQTFADGRLTNPTPAFWEHFETFHEIMRPTYMSMYQPGQALVMAAGIKLGSAWLGILLGTAAMCAGLTWALQAWMPPGWALLGGLIAVLRIGMLSYWMNSYWGGSLAALGGALVLGAYGRFRSRPRAWYGVLAGIGAVILASTRTYEGLVLCAATAIVLFQDCLRRPQLRRKLARMALPVAAIVAAYVGWLGYYNFRVTGHPLLLPYTVDQQQYAVAPRFFFQQARRNVTYHHAWLRVFYMGWEYEQYVERLGAYGIYDKIRNVYDFFYAHLLLIPLLMNLAVLSIRRLRPLLLIGAICFVGFLPEVWLQSHYAAVATVVLYAFLLRGMRVLRAWPSRHEPKGLLVVWAVPLLCLFLLFLPLHAYLRQSPDFPPRWDNWVLGAKQGPFVRLLNEVGGKHLVFVRYGYPHSVHHELVYNGPDIEHEPIIWAREMDPKSDAEVIAHYGGRHVWLLRSEPGAPLLLPYTAANLERVRSIEPTTNPGKSDPLGAPPKNPAPDSDK
jgi:hypothetical protein